MVNLKATRKRPSKHAIAMVPMSRISRDGDERNLFVRPDGEEGFYNFVPGHGGFVMFHILFESREFI
jgi:hypothetical protein